MIVFRTLWGDAGVGFKMLSLGGAAQNRSKGVPRAIARFNRAEVSNFVV